jgi:hypothetical protein
MNELAPTGAETSLLSLPPTHRQTRWAIAVAVCQVAAFALVAPFARTQLAEINAFIPAFEGVIFVTDLVTSVLLFSQFAIYRLRALLVLACGYLFSALMIIPHALTFPGAFSPTGLLGAGLQTTASLYWIWHLLFPMALLGYGLLRDEKSDPGPAEPSLLAVVVGSVALVLTLACGLTLLATAGNNYLPVLFADRVGLTPEARLAAATTMLLSVSAVAVLWLRRRSLLDQWLIIVARDSFDVAGRLLRLRKRHGQDAILEVRLRIVFFDAVERNLAFERSVVALADEFRFVAALGLFSPRIERTPLAIATWTSFSLRPGSSAETVTALSVSLSSSQGQANWRSITGLPTRPSGPNPRKTSSKMRFISR